MREPPCTSACLLCPVSSQTNRQRWLAHSLKLAAHCIDVVHSLVWQRPAPPKLPHTLLLPLPCYPPLPAAAVRRESMQLACRT